MTIFTKLKHSIRRITKGADIVKVSYHEAGHALMAHNVGWKVKYIKITPSTNEYVVGYDLRDDDMALNILTKLEEGQLNNEIIEAAIRRAKVIMAGGVSEYIYARMYNVDYDVMTSLRDKEVFDEIESSLIRNGGISLKEFNVIKDVNEFMRNNWNKVELVVDMLIKSKHGTVKDDVVEMLFNSMDIGRINE